MTLVGEEWLKICIVYVFSDTLGPSEFDDQTEIWRILKVNVFAELKLLIGTLLDSNQPVT